MIPFMWENVELEIVDVLFESMLFDDTIIGH